MGKKDRAQRETKKPKKDAKKITAAAVLPPPMTVEVIKRGKKDREEF